MNAGNETQPQQEHANGAAIPAAAAIPASLDIRFRESYRGPAGEPYRYARQALVSIWFWLVQSRESEAIALREGIAKRVGIDTKYDALRESAGVGALQAQASGATCATSESQLGRRELELLEGLREGQQKMQMAAMESESIRRLRTLVAPGNLEEVLNLARRITLG